MGRALIGGLLQRGVPRASIRVGEAVEAARTAISRDFGVLASADNSAVVSEADLVVVAVKPQDAGTVLAPLKPQIQARRPVIVSVAAGLRTQAFEAWCGPSVAIVRAMPNRPALVGVGATGLFAPESVGSTHREMAEQVMRAVGAVVWVQNEDALDVVTALSGSGPAYFFLLAELMTQAAVSLGLEPSAARTLAVETLHGAGVLAHSGDGDLARLRAEVTSKGGTTEAALRSFDAANLRAIVEQALAAATDRGRQLAEQFGTPSS